MRKILIIASSTAALALLALPASAQVYGGAGPGGVGVQVGPFAARAIAGATHTGTRGIVRTDTQAVGWFAKEP